MIIFVWTQYLTAGRRFQLGDFSLLKDRLAALVCVVVPGVVPRSSALVDYGTTCGTAWVVCVCVCVPTLESVKVGTTLNNLGNACVALQS